MIVDTHVHVYPPDVIRDFEKISERRVILSYFVMARFTSGPPMKM